MAFLGYTKGEIRVYNDKRCCGLWFLIIGIVIIIATILGGEQKINPVIFSVGFVGGLYISTVNKKVVSKLSWGESSKFQNNIAIFSIIMLFILMFIFSGPFFPSQNWRMIWLGTFLAVGLHFFLFYFVHGISMIAIGFFCSLNAIIAILLPGIPFITFAIIDGLIKILFGVYLLFLSKPSVSQRN